MVNLTQKSRKSQKYYLLCKYLVCTFIRILFPKENISAISFISAGHFNIVASGEKFYLGRLRREIFQIYSKSSKIFIVCSICYDFVRFLREAHSNIFFMSRRNRRNFICCANIWYTQPLEAFFRRKTFLLFPLFLWDPQKLRGKSLRSLGA